MPKIVDKDKKRAELAGIAMGLFAEKGFENTAVREITESAGIGKGTFYDYFKDKNDILNEIEKNIFDAWKKIFLAKIDSIQDPIEQLSIIVTEGSQAAKEFEQLTLLYIEIWRKSVKEKGYNRFLETFKSFLLETKSMVVAILERAKESGAILKDVDSAVIATSLIAFIDGICLHYMVLRGDIDVVSISRSFFQHLLWGLQGSR